MNYDRILKDNSPAHYYWTLSRKYSLPFLFPPNSQTHVKGFTSISLYILLLEAITIDQTLYFDTSPKWGFKYGFVINDYYQSKSR
jgi:hypothetical protein